MFANSGFYFGSSDDDVSVEGFFLIVFLYWLGGFNGLLGDIIIYKLYEASKVEIYS